MKSALTLTLLTYFSEEVRTIQTYSQILTQDIGILILKQCMGLTFIALRCCLFVFVVAPNRVRGHYFF